MSDPYENYPFYRSIANQLSSKRNTLSNIDISENTLFGTKDAKKPSAKDAKSPFPSKIILPDSSSSESESSLRPFPQNGTYKAGKIGNSVGFLSSTSKEPNNSLIPPSRNSSLILNNDDSRNLKRSAPVNNKNFSSNGAVVPKIKCPRHPNATLIEDYRAGDVICKACGTVVADRVIDVGPEWRTFSSDNNSKDRSRAGIAESSIIDSQNLTTGIAIDHRNLGETDKLYSNMHNRQNISSSDKSLIKVCRDISVMCDRIGLPRKIIVRAQALFKQIFDSKTLKGRSYDAVSSACLYIACRQEGVPRTFKEICSISKVSKKDIGRCFKQVVKSLGSNIEAIDSIDYMSRFCSILGLNMKVQKLATQICKNVYDSNIATGRSPVSITATSILMACILISDKQTTIIKISQVTGVSESTLKLIYRLFQSHNIKLIPANFNISEYI